MTDITIYKGEIDRLLADPATQAALVATTFKGLTLSNIKQALLEGRMRGFEFEDFLHKNVYAIPFKDSYSLVTSIDYARKIARRSGVTDILAPVFEFGEDGRLVACSVTVKAKTGQYIGDFTATVYFDEYTTGRNLWTTKPRTMLSKVAEAHALRKACPEELSQAYIEEELVKESVPAELQDMDDHDLTLRAAADEGGLEGLQKAWVKLPGAVKAKLQALKDELKAKLQANAN